jgi:hypothetical protein
MLDAGFAVFFKEVNDGFGVAIGAVLMAALNQRLAQRAMIVNFAVEDDPEGAIFVRDRLMPGFEVDDAKAAHADSRAAVGVEAVVVGAAMRHDVAHLAESRSIGPRARFKFENTGDAAH